MFVWMNGKKHAKTTSALNIWHPLASTVMQSDIRTGHFWFEATCILCAHRVNCEIVVGFVTFSIFVLVVCWARKTNASILCDCTYGGRSFILFIALQIVCTRYSLYDRFGREHVNVISRNVSTTKTLAREQKRNTPTVWLFMFGPAHGGSDEKK